jgi:hypothetical protein
MRESCMYGSVRGVRGNSHPYRNRREFIALLRGAVAAWPLAALAQQPQHTTKLVRIGVLAGYPLPPLRKFSQKPKELGYIEGETFRLEYRFAERHDDALVQCLANVS